MNDELWNQERPFESEEDRALRKLFCQPNQWSAENLWRVGETIPEMMERYKVPITGLYKINGRVLALNSGDVVRLDLEGIPYIANQ